MCVMYAVILTADINFTVIVADLAMRSWLGAYNRSQFLVAILSWTSLLHHAQSWY